MAFEFDEEQEMFRESVREFAERKIVPLGLTMEETKEIPQEIKKGMAELGLLACTASPEYGGSGLNAVSAGVIAEELGREYAGQGIEHTQQYVLKKISEGGDSK